jgi:hypothetical protein
MSRIVEGGILTILFFLVVNVVFLNVYSITKSSKESAASTVAAESEHIVSCDEECKKEISSLILATLTPAQMLRQDDVIGFKTNAKREFIIPLGIGATTSQEYTSIPGAEVYIDTALYPNITSVTFETYMSIPTANGFAYVKLFNATDKHDVWFSEQSMETDKIIMRESKITLDNGRKLYQVMMKSTMGYEAKLHAARIRIITE